MHDVFCAWDVLVHNFSDAPLNWPARSVLPDTVAAVTATVASPDTDVVQASSDVTMSSADAGDNPVIDAGPLASPAAAVSTRVFIHASSSEAELDGFWQQSNSAGQLS